jgi:hypothetical protein
MQWIEESVIYSAPLCGVDSCGAKLQRYTAPDGAIRHLFTILSHWPTVRLSAAEHGFAPLRMEKSVIHTLRFSSVLQAVYLAPLSMAQAVID